MKFSMYMVMRHAIKMRHANNQHHCARVSVFFVYSISYKMINFYWLGINNNVSYN